MFKLPPTLKAARGPLGSLALCLGALVATSCPTFADDTSDLISRGRYLATAADCAACHTAPQGGAPFAGGYGIDTPLGRIFSTNITPSKEAGIGNYSEEEFSRAVRDGIAKDGSHLYPAMPYTAYAKITDEDMKALHAYFMQGVKADDHKPQKTELPFPFSIRASMAGWNLLFLDKDRFQPNPAKSAEWNRGAYLSEALEHCSTCHTPRNMFMAEDASKALSGGSIGPWYAPDITASTVSGVGGWSDAELTQYLKTGLVAGKAQAAGPMAEAIENSLQHLPDEDIKAIVTYLRDVSGVASATGTSRDAFGAPSTVVEASLRGLPGQAPDENGFHIFSGSCAACHQAEGQGSDHYPSLFHNTATGGDRLDNLVATILFGLHRTVGETVAFMPAFGADASYTDRLPDKDIADVSNYVLANYGNPAIKVTPADVARIRDGGEKPLIVKLAPFALPAGIAIAVIVIALITWLVLRRRPRPVLG
ncbi:c-type cytochrome [Neorhizobium galegae]|uniref:c-type cytochrome n=1 Tax=Neorhizobium galegae TaxID=399 RepID=UPI000622643A|nr:cytochrome c [Neorhizobium galegae]CDZ51753.1 Gluconate 2-dehydrogenase (Acceptor) [Neorhizobium galegae bv. orientalis]